MLHFTVNNQHLALSEDSDLCLCAGARDFVRFKADFSEEWDGYFIMMRFWRAEEGETSYEVANITRGATYFVPHAVLEREGAFYVTCLGVKGEHSLATVNRLRLDVLGTDLPQEAQPAQAADPTLLSEFMRLLGETAGKLSIAELSFRANETHLQWKYAAEGDEAYRDFIELSRIRGERGERGEQGETGERGERGETGFGVQEIRDADADEITTPGIYFCLSGTKQNFPRETRVYTGAVWLFVFQVMNSAGELNTAQVLFDQNEGSGAILVYGRQLDRLGHGTWTEWVSGVTPRPRSIGEEELKESVVCRSVTHNLFSPKLVGTQANHYLNENGKLIHNTSCATSGHIAVTAGKYVYRTLLSSAMVLRGAFYDTNRRFVYSFGGDDVGDCLELEFETDGYVRLSYRSAGDFPFYYMFARGDASTPFAPYDSGAGLFPSSGIGLGTGLLADRNQVCVGKYNAFERGDGQTVFIVGAGESEEARANALRITAGGRVYSCGTYSSAGADYAEFFEWEDQNPEGEDRTGRLVSLKGDKIALCRADERPFGIISAAPAILGDAASESWQGRYQRDVFGRMIMEKDELGRETPVISEDFDPKREYLPRFQRPEWAPVGLIGKLVVLDDGSLSAGDMIAAGEGGIARKSEEYSPFYVMRRIDDSHVLCFVR